MGMGNYGDTMQMGTSAIGTLTTAAIQLKKAKEARRLAKSLNKPKVTPDVILQNNAMARNSAGSYGLPGQDKIKDALDADTADAIASVETNQQSPAAIAQAAIAAYTKQMQQDSKLGVLAAENKDKNLGMLMHQNDILAGYEDRNWDYNVRIPYERALQEAAQLEGAGLENANTGLSQQGGAIASMFGGSGSGGGEQKVSSGYVGRSYNTGFNNNQTSPGWGGKGQSAPANSSIDSNQIMNYRMKTGDWDSSEIDIMGKMFGNSYGLNY